MKVLQCLACASPLPLGLEPSITCPACGVQTPVPARLHEAQRLLSARAAARALLEPLWQKLGHVPWSGWSWIGFGLALLLPSCGSAAASLWRSPPLAPALITAAIALPALLPGLAIWLYNAAVRVTVLHVQLEMSALTSEGGERSCRSCGAPLLVDEGAIAATCGYCGADSVVTDLPSGAVLTERRRALLKTLHDATSMLRWRRGLIAVGLGVLLVLVAGAMSAIGVVLVVSG